MELKVGLLHFNRLFVQHLPAKHWKAGSDQLLRALTKEVENLCDVFIGRSQQQKRKEKIMVLFYISLLYGYKKLIVSRRGHYISMLMDGDNYYYWTLNGQTT